MIPRAALDELDRTCCELEDQRREPVITSSAWGLTVARSDVNLPGRPVSSAAFPKAHLLGGSGPASLCVWCILERAVSGHGPAPRINGDVRLEPCARHCEPAPKVNPNAGCAAAYPKGRWP